MTPPNNFFYNFSYIQECFLKNFQQLHPTPFARHSFYTSHRSPYRQYFKIVVCNANYNELYDQIFRENLKSSLNAPKFDTTKSEDWSNSTFGKRWFLTLDTINRRTIIREKKYLKRPKTVWYWHWMPEISFDIAFD